jgi:hypothetical protein
MLLILGLIFFALFVFHSLAFDRFVKYLHESMVEEWELIGRPRGMFYNPQNGSYIGMVLLSWRVFRSRQIDFQVDDDAVQKLYKKLQFWDLAIKYYGVIFLVSVFIWVFFFIK